MWFVLQHTEWHSSITRPGCLVYAVGQTVFCNQFFLSIFVMVQLQNVLGRQFPVFIKTLLVLLFWAMLFISLKLLAFPSTFSDCMKVITNVLCNL